MCSTSVSEIVQTHILNAGVEVYPVSSGSLH